MPAIVTCRGTVLEKSWNVGADDLILPAFVAVVVGLFNFALISAVIIALYYIPSSSKSSLPPCFNITYPPILYAPLFSLDFIEVVFIMSEGMFIVFGARGPILNNSKASNLREKVVPILVHFRGLIGLLELASILASLIGVYHPTVLSLQDDCEELVPRLRLAQAVVIIQVVLFALFLIKVCIYTDPLGISTPGLLEKLKMLDDTDSRGSWLEMSADHTPGINELRQTLDEPIPLASDFNIWTRKRTIFKLKEDDFDRVTQVHNDNVSRRNYERRLRAIFCCLGVKGHKSRGAALEDVARGLYTVFSETDVVLSDIIAGFALLRNHQRKVVKKEGEIALTRKFRMVTFKMMPRPQRYGFAPNIIRENYSFDLSSVANQQLLQDLIHYMHYSMGIYGWPLHVFDNMACGFCQLCSVTCCKFRCTHERVKAGEFVSENVCMCGTGTFRLQTGVREEDILYVNYENKIFLAPFIVCLDHKMKAVVVCVRGTLSFKDTLTDMSFSPIHKNVNGIKETYIHGGMYRAAIGIQNTLRKKKLLVRAFKKHRGYQLVVTGHSLGAGVASILALLLKQELKCSDDLIKCYAFSPPGALFSFPLAEYTKSFITTVVLGNDIVPRITLRGLLFLKLSIEEQLTKSELPKYRILFCKKRRRCAHLFTCCCRRKKRENEEDPSSPTARTRQERYRRTGDHFASPQTSAVLSVDSTDSTETRERVEDDFGESIQVDEDCLEWKVLHSGMTTASIRRKLFQRSISIHPDEFSPESKIFSRRKSSVPYRTQNSVATHSFAKKMKKAISFDFDTIPEGAIQGADEVNFSEECAPLEEETVFGTPEPTESSPSVSKKSEIVSDSPKGHVATFTLEYSSQPSEEATTNQNQNSSSLDNVPSEDYPEFSIEHVMPASNESSHAQSSSPEYVSSHTNSIITTNQDTNNPNTPPTTAPALPCEVESDQTNVPPPDSLATNSLTKTSRLKLLAQSNTSLTLNFKDSQSVVSEHSVNSRIVQDGLVKVASCRSSDDRSKEGIEELPGVEESFNRQRKPSDATPGDLLQNAMPKFFEHCRADEGKLFMPFFMPGRVLHLQVKKSQNWCGKDSLVLDEVYRENLCVILVGDGMVDDHLPNNVLSALKAFKSECGVAFKEEEIKRQRKQQESLRHKIRGVPPTSRVNQTDGFIFVNTSAATSPTSSVSSATDAETARRRSHFMKQKSFDKSTDQHPPLAGRRNSRLNNVERSSAGLVRISECADEESPSVRVGKHGLISEDHNIRPSGDSEGISRHTKVEAHDSVDGEPIVVSASDYSTGGVPDDSATGDVASDSANGGVAGDSATGGVAGASATGGVAGASATEGVAGDSATGGVAGDSASGGVAAVQGSTSNNNSSRALPLWQRRQKPPGGLKLNISGDSLNTM